MPEATRFASREEAVTEAITILLDGPYLPRLAFILAALGATSDASALLALQARILQTLSVRPRRKVGSVASGE